MNTLIRFYWHLLLRRAPFLLAIVVLTTAAALAFAMNQPDRYSASAKLLVESPQIPSELASSTVSTGIAEQLGVLQQRLLTRANMIDVANKLKVYPPNEDGDRMSPNDVASAMLSATTIKTSARRNQAAFVDIAFEFADPNIAAAVVNELVTRALEDNVRMRTESASETAEFFEQEVERLSNELSLQSGKIAEFKSMNTNSLPESLDFRMRRQSALEERQANILREKQSLQDQRERIVQVYEQTGQTARDASISETPEQRQLRALEAELSSSLAIYSEQNPRVIVLQTRIEQLRKVVASQSPIDPALDAGASIYEVTLAELDVKIEATENELKTVSSELEELFEQIEKTPRTAIALDAFARDYANIQSQYNAAVAGLARAKTGEQIELTAKGERISVVENAVPPRSPNSPNRKLITAAGGFAGVALAAGVFALLEMINLSIRRPAELVSRVGIAPFATIPNIQTQSQIRRRRLWVAIAFALVLLVLPASLYFIDQFVMPLSEMPAYLQGLI